MSASVLTIVRAVIVRLLFAAHGIVSIWRLFVVTQDTRYWYLATALGLLFTEALVTLGKKGGKEWKWFCPSVFIYLLSVVPSIWFLEIYELDRRILVRENVTMSSGYLDNTAKDLKATLGSVLGVQLEIHIPISLTSDEWIRTLEQLLLLLLILGRGILPKGKLTHDQLSQLLLVYIGTAADIVEFFEAFKEDEVRYNKMLCLVILGIWSLSLLQFSIVLTAARARRDQSGLVPRVTTYKSSDNKVGCCQADVFGIMISIVLQDAPFLVLRMLLIFQYRVLSYTNMFFTSKNTLVIVLLIYRLVVVQLEKRDERNNAYSLAASQSFDSRSLRSYRTVDSGLSSESRDSKSRLAHDLSVSSNGFNDVENSKPTHIKLQRTTVARTLSLDDLDSNF